MSYKISVFKKTGGRIEFSVSSLMSAIDYFNELRKGPYRFEYNVISIYSENGRLYRRWKRPGWSVK